MFGRKSRMATSPNILVTGSAGRIGQAVVRELRARGHPVRGFDIVPTSNAGESITADITDFAAIRRAAAGVHTLIHFAATPDDDDFIDKLVSIIIVGVHLVL